MLAFGSPNGPLLGSNPNQTGKDLNSQRAAGEAAAAGVPGRGSAASDDPFVELQLMPGHEVRTRERMGKPGGGEEVWLQCRSHPPSRA